MTIKQTQSEDPMNLTVGLDHQAFFHFIFCFFYGFFLSIVERVDHLSLLHTEHTRDRKSVV